MMTQPATGRDGRATVHPPTIVRCGLLRVVCATLLVSACAGGGADTSPEEDGAAAEATGAATEETGEQTPEDATDDATEEVAEEIVWSELGQGVEREDPAVFDYEPVRPVASEVVGHNTFQGYEIELITFESPAGGTATGHLTHPVGEPVPGAVVLWAHGLPATGQEVYFGLAIFACAGATSLAIDAPYTRPGGAGMIDPLRFTAEDRDDQIQLIVDMRRGLDLLTDLGGTEFGFAGGSYGASMGAQLIGVDDRVEAAVLVLGSSGLVQRFTTSDGQPRGFLDGVPKPQARDWIVALSPIEPVHYVGDTTAEILFMNGERDPVVPPEYAEELHAAAPETAQVY